MLSLCFHDCFVTPSLCFSISSPMSPSPPTPLFPGVFLCDFFVAVLLRNHLLSLYFVPGATTQQFSKKRLIVTAGGQIKQTIVSQCSKDHRAQNRSKPPLGWFWDMFALGVGVRGKAGAMRWEKMMGALGKESSLCKPEDLWAGIGHQSNSKKSKSDWNLECYVGRRVRFRLGSNDLCSLDKGYWLFFYKERSQKWLGFSLLVFVYHFWDMKNLFHVKWHLKFVRKIIWSLMWSGAGIKKAKSLLWL